MFFVNFPVHAFTVCLCSYLNKICFQFSYLVVSFGPRMPCCLCSQKRSVEKRLLISHSEIIVLASRQKKHEKSH